MRHISFLILIFSFINSNSQTKLNVSLKKELDAIYKLHRMFIALREDKEVGRKTDSLMKVNNFRNPDELLVYLLRLQKSYDSSNIQKIKAIIRQYGYPGKSLVGNPTNEVAFYVLQRYLNDNEKEFMKYLPILKKAAEANELPFRLYAETFDRSLMLQGKEQIYGTQIKAIDLPTSSGLRIMKWIVWPIKDAATVNERRKAISINETVEEKAKQLNFTYQVYTLEEMKKLQGK